MSAAVVMAGIIAIYGLVISVFISTNIHIDDYSLFRQVEKHL